MARVHRFIRGLHCRTSARTHCRNGAADPESTYRSGGADGDGGAGGGGGMGGGAHLQRLFPVQKVRYMYFTGEFIDAAEAYRLGAIERVVSRDEVLINCREIAETIAGKSPAMVRLAKEALSGIEDGDLENKYRSEQGFTYEAYTMEDSQEARNAFVDKRDAKFDDK